MPGSGASAVTSAPEPGSGEPASDQTSDPDDPASNTAAGPVLDDSVLLDVFTHIDAGLALLDPIDEGRDFRFVGINPRALNLLGVPAEEVIGRSVLEFFPGAEAMGIMAAFRRVLRDGQGVPVPPLHYEGRRLNAWFRSDLRRLPGGQLMAMFADATADVMAEQELTESRIRYELLTNSMADGIYDWDLARNTVFFSPTWKAQLGYEDHELPNRLEVWENALHPAQREEVMRDLRRFIAGSETTWEWEFQLRHKSGRYVWIHTRGTPIRNPDTGEVERIVGVHVDIDARKREQLEIERQRRTLDSVFQASPDLYFLINSSGRIEDFQAGTGADPHIPPRTAIGRNIHELLPADVCFKLHSAMQETRGTGELVTVTYGMPLDDDQRYFEARIRHLGDGRFAVIVREITRQRRAELGAESRLRELEGLYNVHCITQSARDMSDLVRRLTPLIARSLYAADNAQVTLELDALHMQYGDNSLKEGGRSTPIFDGHRQRGSLLIRHTNSDPPGEKQSFIDATVLAISLWLQRDNARSNLEVFRKLVANTQDQLALVDRDLRYVVVNEAYAARLGYTPDAFVKHTVMEVLGPSGFDEDHSAKLRNALDGDVIQYREWCSTLDGDRYMNILYSPYRQASEVVGVVISMHDITDLQEAQAQLRRTSRVFTDSDEAVIMTELDGTISDVNPAFTTMFGYAAAAWRIDPGDALAGYAWAWLENLTLAAVKIVPLGQSQGQRLLARLAATIPAAVDAACGLGDDDIGAASPALAIASGCHETQYTRLYRS